MTTAVPAPGAAPLRPSPAAGLRERPGRPRVERARSSHLSARSAFRLCRCTAPGPAGPPSPCRRLSLRARPAGPALLSFRLPGSPAPLVPQRSSSSPPFLPLQARILTKLLGNIKSSNIPFATLEHNQVLGVCAPGVMSDQCLPQRRSQNQQHKLSMAATEPWAVAGNTEDD